MKASAARSQTAKSGYCSQIAIAIQEFGTLELRQFRGNGAETGFYASPAATILVARCLRWFVLDTGASNMKRFNRQLFAVALLCGLLVTIPSPVVVAAEITGRVRDESGLPLVGVRLCLVQAGIDGGSCNRSRLTDAYGRYSFGDVDSAGSYTLRVRMSPSTPEQPDPYENFAWWPSKRTITIDDPGQRVAGVNYRGLFNFGNFHAQMMLTASDVPGIEHFDPAVESVYLKLFTVGDAGDENLIYLGRINRIDRIRLPVSVPLAIDELHYSIYSESVALPVEGLVDVGQ